MTNNNPVETWTREQCEEYLKMYPKSLKSEAVRKRLDALTPKSEPSKAKDDSPKTNASGKQDKGKETQKQTFESSSPQAGPKPSPTSKPHQNNGSTYKNPHEEGMAVVGKVVLTILVLVLCFGIVFLCMELFGGHSTRYTGPISVGVAIPLTNKIWKK